MLPEMREELEKYIYERYINDSFTLRNSLLAIAKELKDKIIIDRVSSIFKGDTLISTIKDVELFWISKALIEVVEDEHIRLDKYFSDREEKEFKNYELPEANRINKRYLVFENVSEVVRNREWLVPILSQEKVEEINDNSLFNYNANTQRPSVVEETRFGERTRIDLNHNSINKMEESMIDGTFSNNEIKVNALNNGKASIEFTPYTYSQDGTLGQLKIEVNYEEGKEVNLIDGMHRYTALLQAIRKAKLEGKTVKTKLSVRVHHVSERIARDIISQQNKQNPFEERIVGYYDVNNNYTIIVDNLNDPQSRTKCVLAGRIARSLDVAMVTGEITSHDILTTAIKREFDIAEKDIERRGIVTDLLADGFNIIVNALNCNSIDNLDVKEDREKSYRFIPEMFNGYVYLCKQAENMPRFTKVVSDVIKKINFSKENGDFSNINISRTKSNKDSNKTIESIIEVFENKLQEVREEMGV